jgi:hypothetical protein
MKLTSLILPLLVSFFAAINTRAQDEKSFSAGILLSPTLSAQTLFNNSAYLFIRSHKSEYFLGLDFYLNKIRGVGGGYQYHFLSEEKKNHWYGELNLRYVKYVSGYAEDGPVDYFSSSDICNDDMIYENTFLNSALCIGREFYLSNIFHFNISLGGGASWKQKKLLDCWVPAYGNESEEAVHPEAVLKIGIGVVAYRK